MEIAELIIAKSEEIRRVAHKYGATNIRVFGSVARGEATRRSDLDLLVDMAPEERLTRLEHMSQELRQILGCKVDVATEGELRPRVRQRAIDEAVPLGTTRCLTRDVRKILRMRRDRDRLLDILDAIDTLQKYAPSADALREYPIQATVVYNVQIIGEAARRLSTALRQQHPEIAWEQVIGMRNHIVHGYFAVHTDKVNEAIEKHLPDLRTKVQAILDRLNLPETP
jgi:uncharacterized protein